MTVKDKAKLSIGSNEKIQYKKQGNFWREEEK